LRYDQGGRGAVYLAVGCGERGAGRRLAEFDDETTFAPTVLPGALLLRRAAEEFRDRAAVLMRGQDIGATMEHLAQTADIISTELAGLAGVFARTREAERQGASSASEWIRHHCMRSGGAAADIKVVGETFNELPLSRLALDDGDIGFGHLVLIARMARYLANSRTAEFDETQLLEHAPKESVGRFFYTCRAMRRVLDPQKGEDEDVADAMSRELDIYDRDDTVAANSARPRP
jgi:hypothetical protein